MLKYKIDILEALKTKGYSTYRLRKERLFGENTIQGFRTNNVTFGEKTIETLCKLLDCQPGDLIEYVK